MIYKILKFLFYVIVILVIFDIGRNFGEKQSKNKYLKDYEYQSSEIDSLQIRVIDLKSTYDSIKKSPCYKKYKK